MMVMLTILVFVAGYVAIAFEHPLRLNKAASALVTGVLCWTLFVLSGVEKEVAVEQLMHHIGEIASILLFLLGAMTIVEIIDSHGGFAIITGMIRTRNKTKLLWVIATTTFFLSAMLDNLTTAIVMTSLVAKLLDAKNDRLMFAGIIVIAANAGGAFSPLGDVTTTMLWIGNQVTARAIIMGLFIPSVFACLVPLLLMSFRFHGQAVEIKNHSGNNLRRKEANVILVVGLLLLILVPLFKTVTHLPPFMGIMLALGIIWIVVSVIHYDKPPDQKRRLTVTHALEKIDTPSILFFLGILLAVTALQSFGMLRHVAIELDQRLGSIYLIGSAFGLISSVVDNVPLVAAAQGMYTLQAYPTDHLFWLFLALTTGTGGSAIIIGSAAGVAAMGIEKIEFVWYLKKISGLAILGFVSGILVFMLQSFLLK